ncbi:DUF262 domain-containing protein [Alkalibacillus haloalkaliphilus]|uniref:GmrSD restriction endonucleases N-terminal domain-containing protein n=1 Tax=Alkalibacillus haloalkaliphilus TaxID=94136 RepID=A0A511W2Y5_9BACI|nr:DUF262 domain-containing protein [Alkalibacillus haloalkaliphilus]GEN45400.1 hypothetical protein AHA02nite_11760 [Alkalibacillus haloalkaliphilus]
MKDLIKDEHIEIETDDNGNGMTMDEEKVNEKYTKGEVRIVTEQGRFQLTTVPSIVESEDYILDPEFQRRHRWSTEKKSRLIESFIMNVPIPPIFLYEIDFSEYEVMDGLQRLTAIYEFYKDGFELNGLEEWKELNGCKYSELPTQVKRGIDRRYLSSMILLKETAKSEKESQRLKQLVFERINSGGERLEPQETRNALYNGPLNSVCMELSRNEHFCKMWNLPEVTQGELDGNPPKELINNPSYKKMQDVELVLRFFAFRHIEKWEKITLTEFLDRFLQQGNLFPAEVLNEYKTLFTETCELVYSIFEEDAFCLYRERKNKWILYNRPTKVIYDPMMYVLSDFIDRKDMLVSQKEKINEDIKEFYKEYYDIFGGRNTGQSDVKNRIEKMQDFFTSYLR